MPIYNVHIHVFNNACAPKRFLEVAHLGVAAPAMKMFLETRVGQFAIQSIKKLFKKSGGKLSKMASFASIGISSSQKDIFNTVAEIYPKDTRFVVLTLNMDFMGGGPCEVDFQTQIDQVIDLRRLHPDTVLPFLCVDPRMGDAETVLQFVQKYVGEALPFIGIKVYPALGYLPNHPHLMPVWQYCTDHQLPVMTHCTPTGVFFLGDLETGMLYDQKTFKYPIDKRKYNAENTDVFLEPAAWAKVFEKHPQLKVCFAHMGGISEMKKSEADNWFAQIKKLMQQYANVYTDVSYSLADAGVWPQITEMLTHEIMGKKVLFGTDYYMTEQEDGERNLAYKLPTHVSNLNKEVHQRFMVKNTEAFLSSQFYEP